MILNLIFSIFQLTPVFQTGDKDFTIVFERIDNTVEIFVNDSLIFNSGIIDNNPALDDAFSIYLGNYLTSKKDEVVIRLYNGHKPYLEQQDDVHWEIKYVIMNGEEEYDYFWDENDENQIGLVFEEKYYL